MRIIIEFRKPSKRLLWKLKRLDRWLDKNLPPFLTLLSGVLIAGGFFVLMGVVGAIDYGDAITGLHIKLLVGALFALAAGVGIGAYIGMDEEDMYDGI
jgi:hypothetical protein